MSVALVPAGLPPDVLADDERRLADRLLARLTGFTQANERQAAYYAGEQRVEDLGIAIPPHLTDILTVVGWPGTVIDVLEERLQHDGWVTPGTDRDLGIDEILEANRLHGEWSGVHIDSFIHGIAFGIAGAGDTDDPNPLVTFESPNRMTVVWDRRRRVVTDAMLISTDDEGKTNGATLWTNRQVIELEYAEQKWTVKQRRPNRLRLPPIVRLANRPRTGDDRGRSEITRAVRAYTDNAVRTVLGMEVSREFFAAPMLWVLGADESSFVGRDGKPKTAWETYIGRIKAIEGSGDDGKQNPDVKQFAGSSPAPFAEQLRVLAQMLSAEAGMPTSYLGMVTDNPPSADSVRALESRLIKRAERRQDTLGPDEGQLMRLAVWIRDRQDPGVTPMPTWRDAATPTRAAQADEATKLVGSGVLDAESEITQRRVGLSERDRTVIADERRRARMATNLDRLREQTDGDEDIRHKAEALGQLIRAGVEPADAARAVGLPDMRFTGAIPVTLRPTEQLADRLEDD